MASDGGITAGECILSIDSKDSLDQYISFGEGARTDKKRV
jgi:hypothetical protein